MKDIPNNNHLLNNMFKYVEPNKIKEIYGLNKKIDNPQEFIKEIKKKYELKSDKLAQQIILEDIINGKISFEMSY